MTVPTNQFNSGTHANIQALVNDVTALIPVASTRPDNGQPQTFSGFDFSETKGFTITLQVSPDGQTLTVTSKPQGGGALGAPLGGQNNQFGPVDGGPAGHYQRVPALVIDGGQLT